MKIASEEAISEAEASIITAQREGRTKGLDQAHDLLQQAKDKYEKVFYNTYNVLELATAIELSHKARNAAENAVRPSLIETHILSFITLATVGIVITSTLIVRWRRNSKRSDTKQKEQSLYSC